ncbi:Acyl-CoA N-acyltransferase [Cordyceps fumosorosea ARSEF 2679]|uniref:Acyl-CoA N-acyltransferase n=1 Tax=Cordyceps fumosorosea (strain ARSEF 2679) TaxID=1081104 RepID=A0A167VYR5_CORFA|nr:Acyl-CoA N-acyltransferase [Cordyceps fumosorosea ARSEF 2679]OAA63129.1 Acyl-CoA N-acyltransferase [Cordyceps fumosorosea ARSEF 2679]
MASTHLTEGALQGRARTSQAVATLAPQFGEDPCFTYILNKLSDDERLSYLDTVFQFLVTAAVANHGTIYETADWQSAAVVLPPGKDVANPVHFVPSGGLPVFAKLGVSGTVKMLYEFPRYVGAVKEAALGKRRFYYVFLVATVPEGRGQGLASRVLRQVLDVAQKEQVPAWIEASTEASRRVYATVGFKELGTVVLGKGKCDAMGLQMKGGPGITVWPMIWEPLDTIQPEKSTPV